MRPSITQNISLRESPCGSSPTGVPHGSAVRDKSRVLGTQSLDPIHIFSLLIIINQHKLPYASVQGVVTYSSKFMDEFSVVEDGSASPGHQLFHAEELSAIVEEECDYTITEYS